MIVRLLFIYFFLMNKYTDNSHARNRFIFFLMPLSQDHKLIVSLLRKHAVIST